MSASAEIRVWWQSSAPTDVEAWFETGPFDPRGEATRTDDYFVEPTDAVGIKRRGGGTEIKLLFGLGPRAGVTPFNHPVEYWAKAMSTIDLDGMRLVAVEKARLLRRFALAVEGVSEIAAGDDDEPVSSDAPVNACRVELTTVRIGSGAGRR